jgi:hypothetical protein
MLLRSVGHFNDSDDDDISNCTDLLELYSAEDAQHYKYDLQPVPIWASPKEVMIYTQGLFQQSHIKQEVWMKMLAKKIWLEKMENLSTDHVRMHQDPQFLV